MKYIQSNYQYDQTQEWSCHNYGKEEELVHRDYNYDYDVAGHEKEILFKNAPYTNFKHCKGFYIDVILYADIESILGQEINYKLNNLHILPDTIEMDFQ